MAENETETVPEVETETPEAPTVEKLKAFQDEKPVDLDINGTVKRFVVREMKDDALADWMLLLNKRFGTKRRPKASDYKGMYSELISRCLYDATGNRVPKAMIQSWGTKVRGRLYYLCQELNGLNDKITEEEGND